MTGELAATAGPALPGARPPVRYLRGGLADPVEHGAGGLEATRVFEMQVVPNGAAPIEEPGRARKAAVEPVVGLVRSANAAAGWVSRLATVCTLPIVRELQSVAERDAVRQHQLWVDPPVDAGGLPVLLIGGLATSVAQLAPLEEWLTRLNCLVEVASIGSGLDCGERTTTQVAQQLSALAAASGRRCLVVGHSRGGQFARVVSVRHPELVEGLVVLGSPLNRLLDVHPLLKVELAVLGLAGALGLPGLLRPTCLWGLCCRRLRAHLAAPFPDDVAFLSVFSKQDRLVNWRSTLDPAARHVEVASTHSGLVCAPEVFAVLADEVGRLTSRLRRSHLR
jgi:pimeloyl-ACP methyl ester carboxylesterase